MLPVSKYKEEIISSVLKHRYTIISARPASGKSTLVPEYLAEHFDKVIVTNPRVIVAITLAMYVAEKNGLTLGEQVGYRTGYDKCASKDTVIEYCTDAFHLIRAIWNENSKKSMALVIDEVHEWTQATEALVGWCKLMQEKWNTKVVIMSATMETEKIAKYFGEDTKVFDIPGTVYDVEVEGYPAGMLEYCIRKEIMARRNVQVFLPSKSEIYHLMMEFQHDEAVVLPFHGDLSFEEQQKCFELYNFPLVVLSTNIGQTGLTIPRINSVVDTGKAIIPIAKNGVEELCKVDISQADIEQRMWRSARTGNGRYILCSDTPIEERERYPVPEIQRSLLDQVVLRFAAIGIDMEQMEFFHQPDASAIKTAKELLKSIGAFDENYMITEIGRKMSKMPVSATCARMIVEAEKYGCVEEVLTISAIVEMGSLLERQKGKDRATAGRYRDFTDESSSDLLAELDTYNYLNEQIETIDFKAMRINGRVFKRVKKHIRKLHEALAGIVEFSSSNNREAILKSCICAYSFKIFTESCFYTGTYFDENGTEWSLNNSSCLNDSWNDTKFVVGKPLTLPGRFGPVNLITFTTAIDRALLPQLVPNEITEETELSYSPSVDGVIVNITKIFRGYLISSESYIDYQHPQLASLKAEYEENQRKREEERRRDFELERRQTPKLEETRQTKIRIDGLLFSVQYELSGYTACRQLVPVVVIEEADLFLFITSDEAFLEDGTKVWFREICSRERFSSVTALKNKLETVRIAKLRNEERDRLSRLGIRTIHDAISKKDRLGKFVLTKDCGGYGKNDIFAYACLILKEDEGKVIGGLTSEEETADRFNQEAIRYLFMKEISNTYRDGKFSKTPGKKKKILNSAELEVKANFDSFVRDVMHEVTLETALDSLKLVEEYYQELVKE